MRRMVLAVILVACGCGDSESDSSRNTTKVHTFMHVYTVAHDGHSYVVAEGHSCCSMLHSPSCPCQQVAK